MEYFIKVYQILAKNPRDLDKAGINPDDVKFKIVPNIEILCKFLKFEQSEDLNSKFITNYDFEKFFGVQDKEKSQLLCQ